MPPGSTVRLIVNGTPRDVTAAPDTPLLYVLRDELRLSGPKFGCGLGQCGACMVHIDGAAVRSCRTPLSAAARGPITTIEGLGTTDKPHPVQQAFIDEQAAQCAYCINGMIMGALGWLRQLKASGRTAPPGEEEIAAFLSGETPGSTLNYVCRCGTHLRIVRAIGRAAEELLS